MRDLNQLAFDFLGIYGYVYGYYSDIICKIIFENIVKLSNQAYVKNNGEFNKSISPKPVFSSNMKQEEKKTDLNLI